MEFKRETGPLSQIEADILIIGLFQDEKIKDTLKKMDAKFGDDLLGAAGDEAERHSFTGKTGQAVSLPTFGTIKAKALMLRGLGKKTEADTNAVRKAVASAAKRLSRQSSLTRVAVDMRFEDKPEFIQAVVEGWMLGSYHFHKYKTKKEDKKHAKLSHLSVVCRDVDEQRFAQSTRQGQVIGECTNLARDMIAEPPAVMTPSRLAELANDIKGAGVSCQIFDQAEAEKQGMGAFLGVARGAAEPAKFIVLRYSNPAAKRTIAIAGKGITFDSGGLSIKTAQGMENMKYDMSGAAAVIATIKALAELQPAVNVIAVAAATENMPGHNAMHPGDILKAMNGKTIEVNNTDAEGRLVLADALCYLTREKPDEIIDLATLTGAVVTALGRAAAGIMGTNEALIKRIIQSGSEAGEKYWQLPLFDEYKDSLKSDVADLKNAGARGDAPSSSAGMFLKEFVDGKPWAHLDIAGPAWADKEKDEMNKGGTGFGVRTLCYYILSQAQAAAGDD